MNAIIILSRRYKRMRGVICILLLSCFLISIVCVPEGDFSLLSQLPALYWHCKATEDADMNFIDFITDHLINVDGIFDKHLPGDDQKPHQPFQFHHFQHVFEYVTAYLQVNVSKPSFGLNTIDLLRNTRIHSNNLACIFHPPDDCLHSQAA